LEERKQELAQIASGMNVEEEKEGKKKKEKGKNIDKESVSSTLSQAIAFAESLLEQATAIKASS
jgi:DNA repair protein RecN (Recombination protein N)